MIRQGVPWNFLCIFLLAVVSVTLLASSQEVQAAGVALQPPFNSTYRLTSFFDHYYPNGNRTSPDNETTIYTGEKTPDCQPHCYPGHGGIDWALPGGTSVLAAADGEVIFSGCNPAEGYGQKIIIDHHNGYYTMYAHLSRRDVNQGDTVVAGEQIALSGNTGRNCQPQWADHLHFTVYRGGYIIAYHETDPFGWRGSGPDPLRDFGIRHTAECLWRG
ncbi:MAG: M23 family metallopeptidase, partial [Chloroflexia bacterium]